MTGVVKSSCKCPVWSFFRSFIPYDIVERHLFGSKVLKCLANTFASAFWPGGLHKKCCTRCRPHQYSSCPSNPGLMQERGGGNACEPVRQNRVYSSLYFFHSFFHWAECNGTDCQADSATAQKKRPYRWWALREFSILILSHGIVQQPLRERLSPCSLFTLCHGAIQNRL